MSQPSTAGETVTLHVENIGGIDETTVQLSPGVTILTGRNATNRTSFLQAIMAVLGNDRATVKGNAEEGHVEMTIGDRTYTRTLTRKGETVVSSGDPYLDDPTLANLFAFLLEVNAARRAVARGDDLREIIMQPVDTADIESRIDSLQAERDRIDAEIEEVTALKQELPDLEGERARLDDEIERKREELADTEARIEEIDADVDERREEQQAFEEHLEELNDMRSDLETARRELDSQQDSLEALRAERADLREEQTDYQDVSQDRLDGINAEIERLREQKSRIDSQVDELQTVIQFNEDLLDGSLDLFADIDEGEGAVTDQLVDDTERVACWTCGSEVDTDQIESMLDRLREMRNEYMSRRNGLDDDIDELNDERRRLEEKQRQRRQIDRRLDTIEDEIHEREGRVADLKARKADLTEEVESLETTVDDLQTEAQTDTELLDRHKEANRLEVEIERLESDREDVTERIEHIEDRGDEREDLEARRDHLQSEIEDLRTRVEHLEQQAVEQFNDHMASLLDILAYDNLERIWIERTEETVTQGRQTVTQGRFDLHIVRTTGSGTVYEDTVEHLSESEREVTGLVFALAGYLVHDVQETAPIMLLDSVEAIDAPRLAELVDYFDQYTDYLVIALLEEDAQALDDSYQRVTEI